MVGDHDELVRRAAQFLPAAKDLLAKLEGHGAAIVVNHHMSAGIVIGWVMGIVDGLQDRGFEIDPEGLLRRRDEGDSCQDS